jgi:hypothetical protein
LSNGAPRVHRTEAVYLGTVDPVRHGYAKSRYRDAW